MTKPYIQVDEVVREMTDEEYSELVASGWTEEGTGDLTSIIQ
jgi:hypothetical protein